MKKRTGKLFVLALILCAACAIGLSACGIFGGHQHVCVGWVQDATCTEDGEIVSVCQQCGYRETEILPALGHQPVTDEAVEATCTEYGFTEGSHCSVCGEIIVEQEFVAASHKPVTDTAVEATCLETGLTEGSHCSVCGETLVAQEVVAALWHNYVDDICTRCGERDISSKGLEYVLNHDKKSYSVTGIGTCTDSEIIIPTVYENLFVTSIEYGAFSGCSSLTSIVIPDSVTSIGGGAFEGCSSLTSVTIGNGMTSIEYGAFS